MVITVQQLTKRGYEKIVRWSLLVTFTIMVLSFLFTPAFEPTPYSLKEEVFEVVDIPDDIEIPPPPKEVEMPKVPVQIEISDEASEDDTIEDTSFDFADDIPAPVATGGGGQTTTFLAFDEPPQPIYRARARYPKLAQEAELEGVVMLLIYVDPRGNVFDVKVLSSTVPQILVDEALKAARKWRFKPGKQRNIPVATTISVPFQFRLSGRH
ncbi:MAG: energy transducer TonB [bacterium]|nr:energy transducer TonB [bacterium]